MSLDLARIQEEIKNPSKRAAIKAAIAQQDWIKFHTDTHIESLISAPYTRFKTFVKSILPEDKYLVTLNLLKFPIPTNEVTDRVFIKLAKIFDGRNPAINYEFASPEQRKDWEQYRTDVLEEPEVWATTAWEFFKTEINCVCVVDLPTEDSGDKYTRPYFYFVTIDNVISYSVNRRTHNMDWIIYRDGSRIIVIDEKSYRTFAMDENGNLATDENGVLRELSNNPHTLGYCPARFFWEEPLSLNQPDIKKSPLSKALSDLDYHLFQILSKRHLDLYGSYPVMSGYEEECDYVGENGETCVKGHLQGADGHWLTDEFGNIKACPLCHNKKSLAGPGTYVNVPIPEEGQPDLRDPIHLLTIDRQSLDYNVEEVERMRKHIINACVGVDNTILNETSLADKQVDATYDSQEGVLNSVKKGFEGLQQFVDSTICRLRYGDKFINAKVNYGTEFYTLTPEVLQKRYNEAKEGGASETELDALKTQLIETSYRHNPNALKRMLILFDIEPYRHLSKSEVLSLKEKGLASDEDVLIKYNFSSLIARFERENGNIIEFGSLIPYDAKIKSIYEGLKTYAKEAIVDNSNQI